MKSWLLVTLSLTVLFLSYTYGAESVLTLTESNFDDTVNNADIILVEFYAPWCGHCKTLAPEFEKAAAVLAKNDPPVKLGKVDATVEKELGDRFDVRGYPTLKIFRNGKAFDYSGPRQADGIVSFMQKQAEPSVHRLSSEDAISTFKKTRGSSVVLGYFSDLSSSLYKSFSSVANSLREEFSFGEVSDPDLHKKHNYNNQIVLSRSDGQVKVFDPKQHSDLNAFISEHSLAVGGEYTESNSKRYQQTGLPVLKVFIPIDYQKNLKRTQYYQRRLQKVGELPSFQGKILFAIANRDTFLKDPSAYGITSTAGNNEFNVVIEQGSNKYVLPSGTSFSTENIQKFAEDFLAGKLEPYIKSDPVPSDNDGPVKVIVGKTFESIVNDDSKNVMIEFYAPWCGHCKTLAPIYEELGKKLQNRKDLVIAKMDATTNDWDKTKYNVNGFPTMYFKKAGKNGEIVAYNGEREVPAMEKWIKKQMVSVSSKDDL